MSLFVCVILPLVVCVVAWIIASKCKTFSTIEMLFQLLAIAAGSLFLVSVLACPISQLGVKSKMKAFESVKATLSVARETQTLENVALQLEVIKSNKWLASTKYWNTTVFEIFIPDEIDKVNTIKQ